MRFSALLLIIMGGLSVENSVSAYESFTFSGNAYGDYSPLEIPGLDSGSYYLSYTAEFPLLSATLDINTEYNEDDRCGANFSECGGENEPFNSEEFKFGQINPTHYRTIITIPPLPPSYYGPDPYDFFCTGQVDCIANIYYTPYQEDFYLNFGYGPSPAENFTITFSSVPEPENWTYLLAGFTLLGGTLRLRRPSWKSIRHS